MYYFFFTKASSFNHWITRLLDLKLLYIGNPYASTKDAIICWCQLLALIHIGPLQLIIKAFYNALQNMTSIPVNWWLAPSSLYFLGMEKVFIIESFQAKEETMKVIMFATRADNLPSLGRSINGWSLLASIKNCQECKCVSLCMYAWLSSNNTSSNDCFAFRMLVGWSYFTETLRL